MVQAQILTSAQFESNFLKNFGRYVAHVPVTRAYSNIGGQETLTPGTGIIVFAIFQRRNTTWLFDKATNIQGGDAYLMAKTADGIEKDDLVYADGVKLDISDIDGNATTITITTSANHGLSADDEIYITSTTNYNGVYTVASITDADTFVISDATHDFDAETEGYTIKDYQKFRIKDVIRRYGVYGSDEEPVYDFCNLFFTEEGAG